MNQLSDINQLADTDIIYPKKDNLNLCLNYETYELSARRLTQSTPHKLYQ